jgi:hypothetical protein
MKINYKNTALGFLEDPMNFKIYCPEYTTEMTLQEEKQFIDSLREATLKNPLREQWLNNVQYVTVPFYEAYHKAAPKIKPMIQQTAFEEAGTLIIPWKGHTQTIFYGLLANGNKENWQYEVMLIMFTKSPHHDEFGLDLFVYLGYRNDANYRERLWKGFADQGRDVSWWIADLMQFKTFLQHADVETKFVSGGRREKHLGEKYVNETKYKIEVLDSTYFTTISRTEGFGVTGHFRWQPYGPGRSGKKLIWISDFVKEGYTRTAKIARDETQQ